MNDFKKLALVAAIIAGLAVIGFLTNSQQHAARAAGGTAVTIDPTQLPLPVKGSLGVSGTIAATQSGAWHVEITGTPNVKVTNPVTAPALTLDISKSAAQHVDLICGLLTINQICTLPPDLRNPYVVPAGQNLIVTSVDIIPTSNGATFALNGGSGGIWNVPNDGLTHSFQYPSGIALPAGFTLDSLLNTAIAVKALLHGYLTPI